MKHTKTNPVPNECGHDMSKWPIIAHLLRVCPDCSAKKTAGHKLTYTMAGKAKKPFALQGGE